MGAKQALPASSAITRRPAGKVPTAARQMSAEMGRAKGAFCATALTWRWPEREKDDGDAISGLPASIAHRNPRPQFACGTESAEGRHWLAAHTV